MGAYVVRTSSLNDKHSYQLFRMGLRDKIHTHIDHTFNQGQHELCGSYYLLLSCVSFFAISMANMSSLVAAPFSSLALLFSSILTANLSCLLVTTFSNLSLLSNSFSSPCFNLLRVARHCFSWSSHDDLFFSSCSFLVLLLALPFLRLILSLSFLCSSVSEALFALSFSFLSDVASFPSMLKLL